MEPTVRLVKGGAGLLLLSALASVALWAQELSHARIVRLSFTEGVVSIQRPDGDEWADAPTNTPIQEGFKIATGDSAFAEVEFENASTARIGQHSLLEFTQLALLPSGGKVNRMNLRQGYATFNVTPEGDDFYEVTAGTATFTPHGKTRFRMDFEEGILQVKVFKGSVEIMSPEGTGTLGKNTVLEIRPGGEEPFQISQGITKDAWDEWVEERESRMDLVRHQGAPSLYSNNAGDMVWGLMDLMYYGSWMSLPGYGYGWAPTVGMGWSPYTMGRWCWYPSMGYTWISHEPWGWLPYHYGSWIYEPTIGWCWIPTGGFGSWSPALVNWYQGPGWVGWAPMSPMLGGSAYNCPRSEGCIAIASEGALRSGESIRPGGVRWTNPGSGRPVDTLDIRPDRSAMLPGSARGGFGPIQRAADSDMERRSGRGQTTPVAGTPSPTGGAVTRPVRSDSGVVFDPESRQYVNSPSVPSTPATPATPAAVPSPSSSPGGFSRGGGISQGGRPGPQANYPTPVARGTGVDADRMGAPGAIAPRGEWGRGTADQGSGSSRGTWSAGTDSGRSPGSASRSTSSTSSRSDSGARSSAGNSSSSSSGGGRSSGGSSGSWGGGSSSGGHSSGGHSSGGSSGGWGGGSSGGGRSSGGGGGGSHGSAGGSGGGARGPR